MQKLLVVIIENKILRFAIKGSALNPSHGGFLTVWFLRVCALLLDFVPQYGMWLEGSSSGTVSLCWVPSEGVS